jgi:hypothetical protein
VSKRSEVAAPPMTREDERALTVLILKLPVRLRCFLRLLALLVGPSLWALLDPVVPNAGSRRA